MEDFIHPLEALFNGKCVKVYDSEEDETFEGVVKDVKILPSNDDYEPDSLVLFVTHNETGEDIEIPVKWNTIKEIKDC